MNKQVKSFTIEYPSGIKMKVRMYPNEDNAGKVKMIVAKGYGSAKFVLIGWS